METYIYASITPKESKREKLSSLLKSLCKLDLKSAIRSAEEYSEKEIYTITHFLNDPIFCEYIKDTNFINKDLEVEINSTYGSFGYEFILNLINLISPLCEKVKATYSHDEEKPKSGHWPIKIRFHKGLILANSERWKFECIDGIDESLIGPALTKYESIDIRRILAFSDVNDFKIKEVFDVFKKLNKKFLFLGRKYGLRVKLDEINNEVFDSFYSEHGDFLENSDRSEYIKSSLVKRVRYIRKTNYLGSCVKALLNTSYLLKILRVSICAGKIGEDLKNKYIVSLTEFEDVSEDKFEENKYELAYSYARYIEKLNDIARQKISSFSDSEFTDFSSFSDIDPEVIYEWAVNYLVLLEKQEEVKQVKTSLRSVVSEIRDLESICFTIENSSGLLDKAKSFLNKNRTARITSCSR